MNTGALSTVLSGNEAATTVIRQVEHGYIQSFRIEPFVAEEGCVLVCEF